MKVTAPNWRARAACAAFPDLFFGSAGEPANERHERTAKAKRICLACPVRAECLSFARACLPAHGIWGGEDFERARPCRNGLHLMSEANTVFDRHGSSCCLACREANRDRMHERQRQEGEAA